MSEKNTHARIEALLSRWITAWMEGARRHAKLVLLASLIATLAAGVYAALELRINSDNVRLIAEHLPSRRNHEAFAELFPNLENALLIVIDGRTPEAARAAAAGLADRLEEQSDYFTDIYVPGGAEFFERNGLLYRSVEDLDDFGDQMARIQPMVAEIERDPSVSNLASLIREGLELARERGTEGDEWPAVLDRVGDATVEVYAEYPVAISWEELILEGSAIESVTRRVIVVHPVLDFENVFAAGESLALIRESVRELGLGEERGVTVRVTGNPALNYQELIGIAWDIGVAGVFCFAIVVGILYLALRSLPVVVSAVVTLLAGLVWTAAFAAAAIGHLNLVSLTFAVLFIGLGVDFGIHLGMRYGDVLYSGHDHAKALQRSAEGVGSSLTICACTTAIGFFVFVPTDYRGVAELGLIAGSGMFIILFQTLTLFPALLSTWLRVDPEKVDAEHLRFHRAWWGYFEAHPKGVAAFAALLGVASIAVMPQLRFDANVIRMRNPNTESVQAFNDLLEESGAASPWYINSVAPDLEEAVARAERLNELEVVSQTLTLADYVPADQDEKLEILEDVAFLLEPPPPAPLGTTSGKEMDIDREIEALRVLYATLSNPWADEGSSPLRESMRVLREKLGVFLARVEAEENAEGALRDFERLLLASFPEQIARLRRSVEASEIRMEDLPPELVERMITPTGRARIQVFPSENLIDESSFARFSDAVREIDPRATGVAVNLLEFGRATRDSFKQALVSAFLVIALLLWLLWRRISLVLLALAPLVLSSLVTCAGMVLLDMPFNFANVVVIPLLLGIGIDSGIHLVHRSEYPDLEGASLLESTTARAVYYSALTTTVSFGTLAFSAHQGMASLGILLTMGMVITVLSNLVVLPALLQLRAGR